MHHIAIISLGAFAARLKVIISNGKRYCQLDGDAHSSLLLRHAIISSVSIGKYKEQNIIGHRQR